MKNVSVLWLLLGVTTKIMGQLYTDDVSDGRCECISVAKNFTKCLNLLLPQVFTINFARNSLYRNYAESFLGRPAKDQAELDGQCYTFGLEAVFLIQQGYDKANIRSVTPTDLDPLSPVTNVLGLGSFLINKTYAQSEGSTTDNQYVTLDQVVWCDRKHALIVRCVNETRRDWKLASIGNPETWAKALTLDIIESLGMSRKNAVDYTGRCPVAPGLLTYKLRAMKRVTGPIPPGF